MAQTQLIAIAPTFAVTGDTSINACVKAGLFPTGIRALGVALPYAIGNVLFGGSAEWIALVFKDMGAETGFAWYVAGCAAISLVVHLAMGETRGTDLYEVGKDGGRTADGASRETPVPTEAGSAAGPVGEPAAATTPESAKTP